MSKSKQTLTDTETNLQLLVESIDWLSVTATEKNELVLISSTYAAIAREQEMFFTTSYARLITIILTTVVTVMLLVFGCSQKTVIISGFAVQILLYAINKVSDVFMTQVRVHEYTILTDSLKTLASKHPLPNEHT